LFAATIYYFSSSYRQKVFYERLSEKANNYAQLLIKLNRIDPELIKIVDRNTAYLVSENIIVYNSKNKLLFKTLEDSPEIQNSFLNKVRAEKEIKFEEGKNEVLALLYINKNDPFVVLVSAYDKYGLNKINNLKIILLIGLLICVIATMLAGWIYAGQALSPISGVIKQVDKITASNLTQHVDEGNGTDEIGQLAVTFNRMLERIRQSFELQKSFVSNSSHELRTPLTSITGQLEVTLMSEREPEEYRTVLNSILEDIKSINRLANGLLELAQADMDISRLKMKKVRIDELLWVSRTDLLKRNADYKINIEIIEFPDEEGKLTVQGSEYLLKSALLNIMDNACKFSDNKEVNITFKSWKEEVEITFSDKGIGISEEDMEKINQPFYRGTNARNFMGHGLGLSLTSKIVALHNGEMKIESKENEFTKVNLKFKLFQPTGN